MGNAVEVLLQLLDHADAPTVAVLLKPENLIVVLRHAGRSDEEVRRALKEGQIPGELLLALFREGRRGEELIAALGERGAAELAAERAATAKAPAKASPAEVPSAKPAAPPRAPVAAKRTSARDLVGMVILLVVMMAPGLIAFVDLRAALAMRGALPLTLGLIAAGGALAGAILAWGRDPLWLGALAGAVCTLGGNVALALWSSWRTSLFKIEIVFVLLVGALPAIIVYHVLRRWRR